MQESGCLYGLCSTRLIGVPVPTGKRGAPGWGVVNVSAPHMFSSLPISNICYPVTGLGGERAGYPGPSGQLAQDA